MRASVPPPLFGYNSSVRRNGRSFHVQTEDSGVGHPHVITHVFVEGGRIVATRRTSYTEHTTSADCASYVRRLLVSQHRDALIALHEGRYDAEAGADSVGDTEVARFALDLSAVAASPRTSAANDRGEPRVATRGLDLVGTDPMSETLDDIMLRDLSTP